MLEWKTVGCFDFFRTDISYTTYYARDEKHVYYMNTVIPGADLQIFTLLDAQESICTVLAYAQDCRQVYYQVKIVFGVNPSLFALIGGEQNYVCNDKHVYCYSKTVSG